MLPEQRAQAAESGRWWRAGRLIQIKELIIPPCKNGNVGCSVAQVTCAPQFKALPPLCLKRGHSRFFLRLLLGLPRSHALSWKIEM